MKKIFDDFTFSAEVLPTIIVVLPLVLIGIYHGALSGEWKQTSIEFITAAAVLYFLARVAKNLGKSYQNKMYAELNSMPTTIVMRFSDEKIDTLSKKKYHEWFNDKDEQYQLPMSLDEEKTDLLSDSKYETAMRDLRNYANSKRELYPRVYQELKKYNYWRNLYGCKTPACILYVALIIREGVKINDFQLNELFFNLGKKYSMLWGLIIWLIIYCVFVTKKVVKQSAFDYAITLIETVCNTSEHNT